MKTLGIQEASELLRIHPVTLSKMASRGEVPGAKIGKEWVFVDVDLIDHIRAQYKLQANVSDSNERSNKCHFSNAKTHQIGGSNLLRPMESEYSKVLGLK